MTTDQEKIKLIVRRECAVRGLNADVLCAIAAVESSWRPHAAKYENRFLNTYKVEQFARLHGIDAETEKTLQKFSYGPLQIMGGTARWLGFTDWLMKLDEPETGVYWGCAYFKKNCAKYLKMTDQLAAYNRGSVERKADGTYVNQEYVNKVMSLLDPSNNK